MRKFLSFRTLSTFLAAILLFACNEKDPSGPIPTGLEVSGSGIEFAAPKAMIPVEKDVWEIYAEFTAGEIVTVKESGGADFIVFKVTPAKDGVGRLRVNADKTWSLVHIDKVSLVVTEGGVADPKAGNAPPIEATYEGDGVWTVPKLYVATDHIRYRFQLETDKPEELKYWCATWDNAGTRPEDYRPGYNLVRALGQKEYDELYLKDNRACWMFPADRMFTLANFTLPMNGAAPELEISFTTAHLGPKAAFIGDSITWLWGLDYYNKKTPADMVYPTDPLPTWAEIKGDNIWLYFHKAFFDSNNYLNRGISNNNTTQMVNRYQAEILDQDPQCVVIMGGTNDLAQGVTKESILMNIKRMAELAEAEHMHVVLCSVTPCNDTYSNLSNPKTKGAHIVALNQMIKEYADSKGFVYCDYYPSLVAEDGYTLRECYWMYDRLHPNPDAYTVMEGIIKPIIEGLIN